MPPLHFLFFVLFGQQFATRGPSTAESIVVAAIRFQSQMIKVDYMAAQCIENVAVMADKQ